MQNYEKLIKAISSGKAVLFTGAGFSRECKNIQSSNIMTAKEQAGHKDISTTLKIYTHLDKTYKAKNIDKFNEHLNAKLRQAT